MHTSAKELVTRSRHPRAVPHRCTPLLCRLSRQCNCHCNYCVASIFPGDVQVAQLAQAPAFALYAVVASSTALWLLAIGTRWKSDVLVYVYLGICSIMGSFTVISCKAVAIALKLTYSGSNQFMFGETYFFALVRSQTGCAISISSRSIVTTWQDAGPLVYFSGMVSGCSVQTHL